MVNQEHLRVLISADVKKLNAGLQSASKSLQGFGSRIKGIGTNLSTRLTLPLAIAGGAAIKMASDFNESLNKVDVAFGKSSNIVKDFAKTTITQFGIAQGSALDMAALFGDMATSMGLSTQKAADMSTQLVGLAGDLASFKNINIEQATTALAGVFTGETESLKRLGIVMTVANLELFAMSQGITKQVKDMTQAEKVLLRYQFIMKSTTNAQGDFARTQKGSANQMRIFQERLKELGVSFGQIILPLFTKLVTNSNKVLKAFKNLSPSTKKLVLAFSGLVAALPIVVTAFGSILTVLGAIISPIGLVVAGIVLLATRFNEIRNVAKDFEVTIKTGLLNIFIKLKAQVDLFLNGLGRLKAIFAELITNKFSADLDSVNKKFDEQADVIKKSRDNTVKYNNEISDLIKANNNLEPTLDVLKRKAKEFSKALFNVGEKAKEAKVELSDVFKPGKFNVLPKVIKQSTTWAGLLNQITKNTSKFNEVELQRTKVQERLNNAMALGSELSNVLYQSFLNLAEGANFFEPIIRAIKSLIIRLVAAAAAAAVLSILLPGGGAGKAEKGLTFAAKFSKFFSSFSGIEFANGGIVSGPTMGLIGEYTGARSNPEVVAPLDRLNSMINNGGSNNVNVTGEFRLKGQDLVVALQRANKQRNRIL
jgi:hypothetical protein